jgi:FKBP-type peptidyl-prolyl cis-trans isomerase
MKPYVTLMLALGGLGAFSAVSAQDIKLNVPASSAPSAAAPAAGAPKAAAPAATHTEAEILQVIGWVMGKNSQVDTFGFSADQLATVLKGFQVAAADKEAPVSLESIGAEVEAYVQKRQDAYVAKLKEKGAAEATKFFADLKSKPGVQFTASGLGYEVLKPGTGANPKTTDTVTANYKGTMISGEVFDSTFDSGEGGKADPVTFELANVIEGWKEGIQKINKGGRIKLYIPSKLAYGEDGRQGIPPNSALIFEVELLDFKATPGPASVGPSLPAPAATK